MRCAAEVVDALRSGAVPKGDVLAVARVAGIAAAKRTPELLPLAHVIGVHGVVVDLEVLDAGVSVRATVRTADRTGVEMEAMVAVSVAALAVVDMVKGMDRTVEIDGVRLLAKSGGRSGEWTRTPKGARTHEHRTGRRRDRPRRRRGQASRRGRQGRRRRRWPVDARACARRGRRRTPAASSSARRRSRPMESTASRRTRPSVAPPPASPPGSPTSAPRRRDLPTSSSCSPATSRSRPRSFPSSSPPCRATMAPTASCSWTATAAANRCSPATGARRSGLRSRGSTRRAG